MRPTDSAGDSRRSDALRFRAALRELNARAASALKLRIAGGLSRPQCAEFFGTSQSAFDVLFLRGVRELRARLESTGDPSRNRPYAEEVEQAEHLAASMEDGSKRPGDLVASNDDGSKRPGDRLLASIDHGLKRPGDRLAASMEDGSALPGASLATSIADSSTSRGENAASTDPGSTLRGDLGALLVLVRRLQAIAPEIRAQDSAALREEETSPGLRRRNLLWRALLLAIVVTGLFLYLKPRPPQRVISRVPQEDLR